jgi:hypothetical protein
MPLKFSQSPEDRDHRLAVRAGTRDSFTRPSQLDVAPDLLSRFEHCNPNDGNGDLAVIGFVSLIHLRVPK